MLLPLILHLVASAQFPDGECEATSQLQSYQVLEAQAQQPVCRTCSDDVCCGGNCRVSRFSNVRSISCINTDIVELIACWDLHLVEVSRDMYCGSGTCARSTFHFTGNNDHCMSCVGSGGTCFFAEFKLLAPATRQTVTLNAHCVNGCTHGRWIVAPNAKLRILCEDGACSRGTVTLGAGSALDLTCNAGTDPETCRGFQVIKGSGATCKLTKVGSISQIADLTAACQDSEAVAAPDECMENGIDADPNTACCATYGCGAPECLCPTPAPEADANAEGDPHIKTLDGQHYTLLKQGTFSLWHFSGLDAEVSKGNKVPVDWQIYSHYSGSQSFTKGLLLVDKSGGSVKQVLELTAQDCEWKARSQKDDWKAVSDEAIAVPDAGTELLVSKKSGAKGHNHVRMKLKTQEGETEVAVLSLSCRPHHSINLELLMRNRADDRFVDGELQTGRRDFSKLAMLQTSTSEDAQFEVKDSWQNLGGSEQAALYLEMNQGMADMSFLSMPCSSEAEDAAKKTCSKHLGDMEKDQTVFQDCVFDLCHGADETVAELAAELRDSTRAI